MTCINKSAWHKIQPSKRNGSHVLSSCFLPVELILSSVLRPLIIFLVRIYLAASRWQLLSNDPFIFWHAKSVISRVLACCRSALDDSIIAVIFMCLLLASKVIGGNELHRNVLVSVLAFRSEGGNCPSCLCEEFSNSPASSFSLTCFKFLFFSCDFNKKPNLKFDYNHLVFMLIIFFLVIKYP